MSIIILEPSQCDVVYHNAAAVFCDFYKKITGKDILITEVDDGVSDLIVIGSDAVNDFLMNEILELRFEDLAIRYGTDDYTIRSHEKDGRKVLVLAGGRGRSTLYAIYAYFEQFLGCHYYWDGDVTPHADTIPLENIDVTESPRFEYRGLRYFAHRGLKRFQAEHWSFEDWKQEIDWMLKKRLNFFMLRIGMDDVWQRAFPEAVSYPKDYYKIEGADAERYNDRTDFWTLKYRGQLREQILEYARQMDLMYPVDCGTMTHWYSRTPQQFLDNKNPSFIIQEIEHYTKSNTGKVFDFTKKENMAYYMHLTDTMVNEYEKTSALFHTIGLGERRMYKDKRKNHALKLVAYRRIAENIRSKYPSSKLMLASWDFIGWWSSDEVQKLVSELDPERTIILDYTSDVNDPADGFINWGVVGKFPWIFGIFHAYESESELRGPYERIDARLKIAADDPYCKGMILWPELSHCDPLILEYLSQNAWSPLQKNIEQMTEDFCQGRYGIHYKAMNTCWQLLLPFIKLGDWGGYSKRTTEDENYIPYCSSWYVHSDVWTKATKALTTIIKNKEDHLIQYFDYRAEQTKPLLKDIVTALKGLAQNPDALSDLFILRDALDMTRTVLSRMLNFLLIEGLKALGNAERIIFLKSRYIEFLEIMQKLLSLSQDFSVYHTLKQLEETAPTNPEFEAVLKRNIYNEYCSQPAYELVTYIIKEEAHVVFDWMMTADKGITPDFSVAYNAIITRFDQTPLKDMQPMDILQPDTIILEAAELVDRMKKDFFGVL